MASVKKISSLLLFFVNDLYCENFPTYNDVVFNLIFARRRLCL